MLLFISSDIHSYFDEWQSALREAGYDKNNKNHCLVVLGDLLDRGPKPIECLDFVNSISESNKILIRGNHEDLLEDALSRNVFLSHDYHNGTAQTIRILANEYDNNKLACEKVVRDERLNKYLNSLVDYYETDKHIFVHGWIPTDKHVAYNIYDPDWRTGDWKTARWKNGMDAWRDRVIEPGKTIWCGHWHTSWGHCWIDGKCEEWEDDLDFFDEEEREFKHPIYTPFMKKGIVAMDACTAVSGIVNCKKLRISI